MFPRLFIAYCVPSLSRDGSVVRFTRNAVKQRFSFRYYCPRSTKQVCPAIRASSRHVTRTPKAPSVSSVKTTSLLAKRSLHTSAPRRAPQFLLLIFGPASRFLVALGGRLTRSWWSRLTPEKRAAIKSSVRKNARYFYGVFAVFSLFGLGYYASHVEETPITRRRRFIMFPREQVLKMIESERKNILEAVCNADKESVLEQSHPHYTQVHGIVSRILSSNDTPEFKGFDWRLYVIDQPNTVNALCLPTGDIFVFTGLVKQTRNDDELAFILSHEMAHAVLGHGMEALSRNGVINFVQLFVIAVIWAIVPSDVLSYFMHSLSRSTVKVLLEYPHSRKLEKEADRVGLLIASRACYDPRQAVNVWEHLQNVDLGKELEFLSTHPANETRLETLEVLLPEAYGEWQRSECTETREEVLGFQETIKKQLKKVFVW